MRRFIATPKGALSHSNIAFASAMFNATLSKEARDAITKSLSRVKDEAKGQLLDLTDMNEASRNAGNALQEVLKRNAVDDIKVKGKIATLTASLKSYNTRLSNLQSEARSVQTEADALIKMLWGNSNAAEATKAQAPTPNADPSSDDFGVDVPPIAKKIEQVLGESRPSSSIDSSSETTSSNQPPAPSQKVETLEGDFIREDLTAPKSAQSTSTGTDEDLEIELEVDGSTSNASPVKSANELLADKASIPEITTELHNNGIDFSSCRDADSLRKKYLEFLEGKFKKPSAKPNHNQEQRTTQQPPTPRPPQQQQQQSQYQQAASNTTETGVSSDPYPNGVRKMIDPMKTVWEVKMEIAKERNMDANTVNLWSGKICLEDHKRLYDYPTIQQFPIEVRSKGDTPS